MEPIDIDILHSFYHYLLFTCFGLKTQYEGDDNLEKP